MARRNRSQTGSSHSAAEPRGRARPEVVPEPKDVVDGIPDRSTKRRLWVLLVLGAIFLGWVAFLIYCRIAGSA